jgi:hypothetical protein
MIVAVMNRGGMTLTVIPLRPNSCASERINVAQLGAKRISFRLAVETRNSYV